MVAPHQQNLESVRIAVQREFINRCRKNPSYSLRAFAKYLDIDQSFLSKILKGKRPITSNMADSIGTRLGLKPSSLNVLVARSPNLKTEFLKLSEDEFELLSEWHHFTILELSKTKNFNSDARKIALRLGIHVEEVRDALNRLQRLKFIRIRNKRIELLTPNNTWTNNDRTSGARRKLQRTLLEKSLYALEQVPFDRRDNGSLTVAINSDRIPEFKEKLQQIRTELSDFFQPKGEKNLDQVYQLTVSFFPLTKKENETGEKV